MADLFAPKFQGDVAFERPLQAVEQPSALAALAGLGEFFVKDYGAKLDADARAATKRASSIDPNLSVFQQGLERVQALRDQKGEAAALIAERQLAKNFALQGIEFDTDYQNVYTATTGRPWAGYGRDNESFMREQALQDPQVQASYVASFAILPKDSTDEQRIEYAIGQKATLQASADVIARSKAEAGYAWSVETEAAYGKAIDTFLSANLGSLVSTVQGGGRVGPQALANLTASWSQLKVNISRPSGVSDDQWKSTQSKITNIDTMLTNLQKASSSDVLFEEITTAMANSLIKEGGGDVTSLLSAMTAIKDPSSLTNLMGGNVETFIMDIGKSINLDITQPQLFSHLLEQSTGQDAGSTITITELPPSIQAKVKGLSPQQYYDGLKASGQLTGLVDPNALQRPEGRQQFVENAAGIGAVMMSMENDQFLSSDFLKQLVANPQFIRNVTALEAVDPEGAAVVRSYIVSGLNTELARQQRNVAVIEQNLGAVWDGSKYVITRESIMQKGGFTEEQADRFLAWVGKTYGGNTAQLANGMVPLPEGMGFNPQGLASAYDRRNAMNVIQTTVNSLTPQRPEQEPLPTAELPSNASVVNRNGFEIAVNKSMSPLIGSMEGASKLTVQGADTNLDAVLTGPFQDLQKRFGKPLIINDALAKAGTSRETETKGSRHFHGDALDISLAGMSDAEKVKLVEDAVAAGFQGFGFGNNILHIDMGAKRVWNYSISKFGGLDINEMYAKVTGSSVPRPVMTVQTQTGDLQTPEVDANESAPVDFQIISEVTAPVAQVETTPTQPVEEQLLDQPIEEQPQQETPQAQPQAQPTVAPEVQALIDSLTNASEEDKQRILDFLNGGQ